MNAYPANPQTRNRVSTVLISALIAVALCTVTAQANELINPNLDQTAVGPQNNPTPVNWTVFSWRNLSGVHGDGASSEPWCNIQGPDGKGLFFKPFQGQIGDEISVYFYQDLPAAPGTKYTLSGYAAGEANFCAFYNTNTPAPKVYFVVEFRDGGDAGLVTNMFDLVANGLPASGPGSMTLMITPQFTAPPGTVKVRAGAYMLNAYSTTGAQSFFVDAFDLTSEAPAGAPEITEQPSHTTVSPGGTAKFSVVLANTGGVTYEWQKDGQPISNGGNISGANTATLTVANASASDVGRYRVRVSNTAGAVLSKEVALALTSISMYPVISITGKVGDRYRIEYANRVDTNTWLTLSTNLLTTSPQLIIDPTSPMDNSRFYRAVLLE